MSCTPHTNCRRGKRVILTLKNGTRYVDKFIERTGKGVKLERLGVVRGRDIRAMTIYRGQKIGAVQR